MSATLKDIAREVGMSMDTVSRALRGKGYVSKTTLEAIRAAAARLGYRPNLSARGLKYRRTQEVAVFLPLADELSTRTIVGVKRILDDSPYMVSLRFDRSSGVYDERILARSVESEPLGVIVFPFPDEKQRAIQAFLTARGIASVKIGIGSGMAETEGAFLDYETGVREALARFRATGRRRIAYLGISTPHDLFRRNAYLNTMVEWGQDPVSIIMSHLTGGGEEAIFREGMTAAAELIAMSPRPDAVQAYSDVMAAGLITGLFNGGLKVPDDIAVIGFDDRKLAAFFRPRMTSIALPLEDAGAAAAEALLAKIEGREPLPAKSLPARLTLRETA